MRAKFDLTWLLELCRQQQRRLDGLERKVGIDDNERRALQQCNVLANLRRKQTEKLRKLRAKRPLTSSGVISLCIVISPTASLKSPSLSRITAQLAVGDVSETKLPPVALAGSVSRRNSPFWSFPKADMRETAPFNFCNPSAMLRPTPPPANFVSDLYVAPFSCKSQNRQWNEMKMLYSNLRFSFAKWKGKNKQKKATARRRKFIAHEHVKSFMSCDKKAKRSFFCCYFWMRAKEQSKNEHNLKCNGRELNENNNKLGARREQTESGTTKHESVLRVAVVHRIALQDDGGRGRGMNFVFGTVRKSPISFAWAAEVFVPRVRCNPSRKGTRKIKKLRWIAIKKK